MWHNIKKIKRKLIKNLKLKKLKKKYLKKQRGGWATPMAFREKIK